MLGAYLLLNDMFHSQKLIFFQVIHNDLHNKSEIYENFFM